MVMTFAPLFSRTKIRIASRVAGSCVFSKTAATALGGSVALAHAASPIGQVARIDTNAIFTDAEKLFTCFCCFFQSAKVKHFRTIFACEISFYAWVFHERI